MSSGSQLSPLGVNSPVVCDGWAYLMKTFNLILGLAIERWVQPP